MNGPSSVFSKRRLRGFFAALVCLSLLGVGVGVATSSTDATFESHLDAGGVADGDEQVVPVRDGVTVVATDSNSWRGKQSDGPRARAELVAFDADGSVLYYNDTHTRYWDVDPVAGADATVEYAYADHVENPNCPTDWSSRRYRVNQTVWTEYVRANEDVGACTENGVERVNLTTGEVTPVWSTVTPGKEATRYHDADRLDETHLVVADIFLDRVFVVDTEDDRIEWTWNASDAFSTDDSGGPYPADWTHINDVEALSDGRIMVSVRNHDQVVFLKPGHGLLREQTLGRDDARRRLYEQHNPDYVPEEHGGPAVPVADSENNRIVEYQRVDGEWKRTWVWRDARLQWPRDADRLPNGHTLVTDSNGNRVFEVDENGEVVWSVDIAFPYEAERLGTGDESTDGPSARDAGVESRNASLGDWFWITVKQQLPGRYLNGLMYVTPVWMGLSEAVALAFGSFVALVWAGLELGWVVSSRVSSSWR